MNYGQPDSQTVARHVAVLVVIAGLILFGLHYAGVRGLGSASASVSLGG